MNKLFPSNSDIHFGKGMDQLIQILLENTEFVEGEGLRTKEEDPMGGLK
jgi:hypothetical protein